MAALAALAALANNLCHGEPADPADGLPLDQETICGPVSLALAARMTGVAVSAEEAVDIINPDKKNGSTIPQLAAAAISVGVRAAAFELKSVNRLARLARDTPAIVLLRGNHFAVAWGSGKGDIWLAEYPNAPRRIKPSDLAKECDLRILVISRNPVGPEIFFSPIRKCAPWFLAALGLALCLYPWLRYLRRKRRAKRASSKRDEAKTA